MIYSPDRSYLFIHIPKTGGTALAQALEARAMKDDILIGDTPKAQRRRKRAQGLPAKGRLWKHSTLRDLDGWLSPDVFADLFVFTLVRNPWDRMVSYYHWLRDQSFDHLAVTLAKRHSFADFIKNETTQTAIKANPSKSYVTDATGAGRCRAYIRLEHLDEDLAPLEAHLGFKVAIPHTNVSDRHADYRRYYDDALVALVADIASQDIQQFGYRFDDGPVRQGLTKS